MGKLAIEVAAIPLRERSADACFTQIGHIFQLL
jgi:hypothetical protein